MKSPFVLVIYCILWTLCIAGSVVSARESAPIIIGGTLSLEGKYHEPSMMVQEAFKYWVEEVNDRGGLLGRKIELILYNDRSDPELTRKLYQKLIEEDRVDLVFSPISTPLTMAASEVSEKKKCLCWRLPLHRGNHGSVTPVICFNFMHLRTDSLLAYSISWLKNG